MDSMKTVLVCAAAAALLGLAYFWSLGSGRSAPPTAHGQAAPRATPEALEPALDPPADREPVADTLAAIEGTEPERQEPTAEALPSSRLERPLAESGSKAAAEVLRLLEDRDFLDACEHPEDTSTSTLEGLVSQARGAVSGLAGEEGIARAEAGLFKPVPGYKPGEPTNFHLNEGDLLQSIYSTGTGDANLVELPREEHRELYALRDAMKRLEAELRARRRAATK